MTLPPDPPGGPIRTLLVDGTSTFGGAFEQVINIVNLLGEDSRFRFAIVSPRPASEVASRLRVAVPIYSIPPPRSRPPHALSPTRSPRLLALASDMLRDIVPSMLRTISIARRERSEVIFLNNLLNVQLGEAIAAILLSVHCISAHQDFEYPSRSVKRVARWIPHHVAISSAIQNHLIEFGILPDRISLIHPCVDESRFHPDVEPANLAVRFGIPHGHSIVSIFGRLVGWKGQDVFLRAFELARREIANLHALIVGDISDGDPRFLDHLHALVHELGIGGAVTFTGYQSDIPALMRASDIVVHASIRPEPFGLVVLEAMAVGCCVVASAEGGPLDIISSGESGVLVRPNDPTLLARSLIELAQSPALRKTLSQRARDCFRQGFSADVAAQKYAALFLSQVR